MHNTTEKISKLRAQDRVAELKKFYKNIGNLLFFIILLGSINYALDGLNNPWFLWIIGLMSLGLCIDAVRTFVVPRVFRKWEQRTLKKILKNDNF